VAATAGLLQLIFMGIAPKKSRLPMSTPQWLLRQSGESRDEELPLGAT